MGHPRKLFAFAPEEGATRTASGLGPGKRKVVDRRTIPGQMVCSVTRGIRESKQDHWKLNLQT
jgi:hypothetical protein